MIPKNRFAKRIHEILNFLFAATWLGNGLFCKVFNLAPRHQQIVETILNLRDGRTITVLIGVAETLMAVWILSGIWPRVNTVTQIVVIATMNILEFVLVPELLLWGKANVVFAFLFILLIGYNEFIFKKKAVDS